VRIRVGACCTQRSGRATRPPAPLDKKAPAADDPGIVRNLIRQATLGTTIVVALAAWSARAGAQPVLLVPGFEATRLATGIDAPLQVSVAPDGTATIDVRMTLETPAGALVFVEYTGRSHLETGLTYATPTFRTGDPDLAWLNRVQTVAKGFFDAEAMTVTYPVIYELR